MPIHHKNKLNSHTRIDVYQTYFIEMMMVERGASTHTLDAYQRDLQSVQAMLKTHKVDFLTATSSELQNVLKGWKDEGLARTTINRKLSCLKQFYKFLQSENYRKDNPVTLLRPPRAHRQQPHILSTADITQLFVCNEANVAAAANKQKTHKSLHYNYRPLRIACQLEILYAAGLRISELVALPLSAIHQSDNCLLIKGKGQRERLIPLTDKAIQSLEKWLTVRAHSLPTQPPDTVKQATRYVFPSRGHTGHMSRERFGQALKALAQQAHLDPQTLSPHSLRHAFASHMLAGGAGLRALQKLLGHADITTTQIYTHVLDERLQKIVQQNHPLAHYPHI